VLLASLASKILLKCQNPTELPIDIKSQVLCIALARPWDQNPKCQTSIHEDFLASVPGRYVRVDEDMVPTGPVWVNVKDTLDPAAPYCPMFIFKDTSQDGWYVGRVIEFDATAKKSDAFGAHCLAWFGDRAADDPLIDVMPSDHVCIPWHGGQKTSVVQHVTTQDKYLYIGMCHDVDEQILSDYVRKIEAFNREQMGLADDELGADEEVATEIDAAASSVPDVIGVPIVAFESAASKHRKRGARRGLAKACATLLRAYEAERWADCAELLSTMRANQQVACELERFFEPQLASDDVPPPADLSAHPHRHTLAQPHMWVSRVCVYVCVCVRVCVRICVCVWFSMFERLESMDKWRRDKGWRS
jgi:hypothetical protein